MKTAHAYLYSVPGRDASRFYQVCESEWMDGWYICWHTQSGAAHHTVKKLGKFETAQEAATVLDKLAVSMGMQRWVDFDKPNRFGQRGEWVKMEATHG